MPPLGLDHTAQHFNNITGAHHPWSVSCNESPEFSSARDRG